MSCWLPQPIGDQIPDGLIQLFSRLRSVRVIAANQSTIDTIVALPTLVSLHCLGGTFDASVLEQLGKNIHFSTLRLSRRSLSESDLDAISKLPWLTGLELSDTDLNSKMLRCFDQMPRLRTVNLTATPLVLSELGVPQWSSTVRELTLSRPPKGVEGSLVIDGWPRLRRLRVTRPSVILNASALEIRLSNLPNLQYLQLDRVQKHELTLHNLPRLATINEGLSQIQFLRDSGSPYPGLTWLKKLDLDGLDSLTTFGCFVRDLESMSIRDARSLRRLALGSYLETSTGDVLLQPANAERCQTWIDHIGQLDGPGTVDFTAFPLRQADLSPLVDNPRIRHLYFADSGVSFQQIEQLEGMKQLESLDLRSCRLEEDQLSWLLDRFPNMKDLSINGADLTRFDLTGRGHLKTIMTSPLENIQDIRIVDLPSLKTFISMYQTPQRLEIRNAQSLRGLALRAPWPNNAPISGLRDLDWFAGGGAEIDNAMMDVLLQCRDLDQLTLAYTSITREKLIEAGQLKRLSMLALPGAEVDDEVTSHWHQLTSLWDLNLDDTSVSVATIAWASGIESLRRLSLNRVELNEAAVDAIAELRQVSELHLADTAIQIKNLKPLFDVGNLEVLNFSGREVDTELLEALGDASSLRVLILHDSNIDASSLDRMLLSNPSLYVDLGTVPDSVNEEQMSELRRRALLVRRGLNSGWRHAIHMRGGGNIASYRRQEELVEQSSRQLDPRLPANQGTNNLQVFRRPHTVDNQSLK